MQPWVHEAFIFLRALVGESATAADWVVFFGTTLLVSLIMMKLMAVAAGNGRGTWAMNLLGFLISGTLILAAIVAGRVWGLPLLRDYWSPITLDALSAFLGLVLLAAPVFCLLQRVRYLTGFMTLLVAGFSAGMVYLLAASALRATREGQAVGRKVQERNQNLPAILESE